MTNLRNWFITISFIILGSGDSSICKSGSNEVLNSGGWVGYINEEEPNVYHRLGNAILSHYPPIPIKHGSVTFTCYVDGADYKSTRYRWFRNGEPVLNVVTQKWIDDSLNLYSRTNYSCVAYNDVDNSGAAWEELMIYAPPRFIQRPPTYQGALASAPEYSLTCRVECYPECQVLWFKDGVHIDNATDDHYFIKSNYLPADLGYGYFESFLSILNFNMSAWPENKLDILHDNAIYSCKSTDNVAGRGVKSTSLFTVDYPPENVAISTSMVVQQDGLSIPKLKCSAKAVPQPIYDWHHNGEIIMSGSTLMISFPIGQNNTEIYTCRAKNHHGSQTADIFFNGTSRQ